MDTQISNLFPLHTTSLKDEQSRIDSDTRQQANKAVMQELYGLLLNEICKSTMKTNSLISRDSPITLSGNNPLTETFWNQVLKTIADQADWASVAVHSSENSSENSSEGRSGTRSGNSNYESSS